MRIAGSEVVAPQGVLARNDAGGYQSVVHAPVPPARVLGISPPTVRTFLFACSMVAALFDTAQRQGQL